MDLTFIGKKFNYTEIINENNKNAELWYNSLIYINIQNLFTPFFQNIDVEIEKAIKNNTKKCKIQYQYCVNQQYVYNENFIRTLKQDIQQYNNKKISNCEYRNIYNKFNIPIIDETFNGVSINNNILPFCRKLEYNNRENLMYISLYYKDWFNIMNYFNPVSEQENIDNNIFNIFSERLPIQFIEHLFTINNLNFKEIITNKISGVKEIIFNEYDFEIIFY